MKAPRVRVFRVEGMDCADCARKVASALEEVPGVVGVQVNYASGKAYLVLEREEALREAEARLAPLGYHALLRATTMRTTLHLHTEEALHFIAADFHRIETLT